MAQTLPPFYPQETDFSCAVACLRMALAHLGVPKSEAELRELCDCAIFGTSALELTQAARKLGFTDSRKFNLTLEDLKELTGQGYFPIVYVVSFLPGPTPDVHSLVVVTAAEAGIRVLDPRRGPLALSPEEFIEMWSPIRNLAIVIARGPDFLPPGKT